MLDAMESWEHLSLDCLDICRPIVIQVLTELVAVYFGHYKEGALAFVIR